MLRSALPELTDTAALSRSALPELTDTADGDRESEARAEPQATGPSLMMSKLALPE